MYAPDMIRTHPRGTAVDADALAAGIEACYACSQACVACADACLGEPEAQPLVRCIRLNEDCAAVCAATGAMLSRLNDPHPEVLGAQLAACLAACRACAEECGRHGEHMEHCRLCAEACRACEDACHDVRRALAS